MTDFLDKLRTIVGERGLITDAQGQHPYLTDWRDNYLGTALAVVRPATTEEVAAVVKLCAAEKVAIVPQGGNTGMVGGGTPHENGHEIVLSLNRMNRIVEIDEIGYSMTVEAGVVLKTIQETAARHDRLFPLSLAAEGSCTIGGNLSTNAGGVQGLHYGNARQPVLGLEAVTPQGEIWNGLRALKKDNTGYDLREPILAAEGTVGILTGPVLKRDVSVSVSKVPAFMREGLAAMKKALPECRPLPFGHVGDGNLHFNCQAPPGWDKARFMAHAEAISGAVYDLVVGYGGSISAEHGIGQLKVDELAHYRSRIELDTMRAIKRALDPQNLMNPGKVVRV